MNDRENLDYLKSDYMDLDYPEDLNISILSAISKSRDEGLKSRHRIKFYIPLGIGFSFALLFMVLITNRNSYDPTVDMSQMRMSKFSGNSYTNFLAEDEFIISVYPKDKELTFKDNIYNIDKRTGEIITLDDILLDNIDDIDIDGELKNDLKLEDNKFYIDNNGMYVILTPNKKIVVDDNLKYKIFMDFN